VSRSEYLPPECWEKIYSVMQRHNVNAMRVSLETGMRIDDVLSLRTAQIKSAQKHKNMLEYTAKKTGKTGKTKLSTGLLRELLICAGETWVFPGRTGAKHRTRQTVYKDVKKATKLLGVQGQVSPHSARKTFAVELRKKSGIAEVQKALQHTNAETTNLYAFADVAVRGGATETDMEALAEYIAQKVVEKMRLLTEL